MNAPQRRRALEALDGGGRLLVTSATLTKGWSMAPELLDFVSEYLHVGATSPTSSGWIAGAVGERFDGVRFAVPGVTYLDPDAQSSTLFVDDDLESGSIGRSVGTRFPSTGSAPYRVVYLGFDLHRLESADGRRYVLQRSLETLLSAPLSATPDLLVDRNLGAYHRFTTLPGTNLMHVGSIDVALLVARTTYATATVVVVDAAGRPVPGATVSGFWMGTAGDADVGGTDAAGRVTFTSDATRGTIPRNSIFYEFRVQGLARAGWNYEETANEETSDVVQAP